MSTSAQRTEEMRARERRTLHRIWANPEVGPCPNCSLYKPREKPVCECCAAEARGEYLSDHQAA